MMWLARFFLLYSSYSHAALDISITPKYLSTISKKVSGKSPNKSSTNHRFLPQLFSWFMQYKDLIDAKLLVFHEPCWHQP